ncbi:START domain-containing protein 10-like [Corticium candelabrum]|uniref:START domain-containing protein 10-like n=1 Tax=Corticium candelabrum TaxID=121492 RepID=UPI002E258AEF|nr:START domain-containing protein 10-like [Corticium candelabrum]
MAEALSSSLGTTPRPATDEDFDYFKKLADIDKGWSRQYDSNGIVVWTQTSEVSSIKLLRVQYVFQDISADVLYDVIHDPDYRRVWDDHMIDGFEICTLDATNDIGYYSVKCPPGVTNRDFVNERSWRVNDEEYMIFNHTVYHKDHPEKKNFVRAFSYLTGYVLRPQENGACAFTYVTQTDMKGWIPAWLTNKAATFFAPKIIEKLHKASLGYVEWKKEHKPEFKPWLKPEQMTKPTPLEQLVVPDTTQQS